MIEKRVMVRTKRNNSFRALRRFSITSRKEIKTRMTIKIQNRLVEVETTSVLNLSVDANVESKFLTQSWPVLNKQFTRKPSKKFWFWNRRAVIIIFDLLTNRKHHKIRVAAVLFCARSRVNNNIMTCVCVCVYLVRDVWPTAVIVRYMSSQRWTLVYYNGLVYRVNVFYIIRSAAVLKRTWRRHNGVCS